MDGITYIGITVADKIAQSDGTVYVCDNSVYKIRFTFDEAWAEEPVKNVRIKWGSQSHTEVIEGDEIEVPTISGVQRFEVYVTAGKLRTDKPAIVLCRESILGGDGEPDEPQEEDPDGVSGGIALLEVSVSEKIALGDGTPYVCDNANAYRILFDFDAEWAQEFVKTARFRYGNKYLDKVFEGNEVAVPRISGVYRFEVGVFAGNRRATTAAVIPCRKSILSDDGTPDTPTPDVYSQIMAQLNDMMTLYGPANVAKTIEAGLKAAKDSGMFKGDKGDDFTYSDFTAAQLAALKGDKGDPFIYSDFTDDQLAALVGKPGSSIDRIVRTSGNGLPGTTDTYTITLTNGKKHTFTVTNGNNGAPGRTPVKGEDYYTPEEKAEIVEDVMEALPSLPGGAVDAVRYGEQSLTEAQQTQARKNIGAAGSVNGEKPDNSGNIKIKNVLTDVEVAQLNSYII